MSGSHVALVAESSSLAENLHGFLSQAYGRTVPQAGFSSIRPLLGLDSAGLLVIAVDRAEEIEALKQLVQDISLQKLPARVVIVEGPGVPIGRLNHLDRYVAGRLLWPEDRERLAGWVHDAGSVTGQVFLQAEPTALTDLLRRRLLAWTPSLLPLVERIALAATHDVIVLLNGETGTGKTYLARLLHEYSPRRQHRFLTVPCGAVSANLIESEFFGHVKGAFTGADRPKTGKFAAVGQGTLLLDEIDTLALEQQSTLLRVIETGEFEPVGSNETQRCRARLIVASNVDLERAVAQGRFRPDLYFRLNVMALHLAPLRDRTEDIVLLARGMAANFNHKFRKELFDIHPATLAALESYPWPGNLRQLENVIQHAVLVSSGEELLPRHLPGAMQDLFEDRDESGVRSQESGVRGQRSGVNGNGSATLHHQRDLIERNVIQRALASHGFSRTRAADSLGISRVTLYKKMKKYGLMKNPLPTA